MKSLNVQEIVKKYLKEEGYDGLYISDCCCIIENLMPCDEPVYCRAGYAIKCDHKRECEETICMTSQKNRKKCIYEEE